MKIKKEQVLSRLHDEVKRRNLANDIAKAYGCTPSYVHLVLRGKTKFIKEIIDISLNILEKDKIKESSTLTRVAQKLGF